MRRRLDSIGLWLGTAWERLGHIGAVHVVAGLYVAIVVLAVSLRSPGDSWLWAATLGMFVVCCFARRNGMRLLAIAWMPGCTAFFAHELLGAPRWVGVALIPAALWMAWSEDRSSGDAPSQPSSPDAIASTR